MTPIIKPCQSIPGRKDIKLPTESSGIGMMFSTHFLDASEKNYSVPENVKRYREHHIIKQQLVAILLKKRGHGDLGTEKENRGGRRQGRMFQERLNWSGRVRNEDERGLAQFLGGRNNAWRKAKNRRTKRLDQRLEALVRAEIRGC